MPRAQNKDELIESAIKNFEKMWQTIGSMDTTTHNTPFDFSSDSKKTEQHWSRDRNVRDILIHLYEWHQLLLTWVHNNQVGNTAHFLPAPYNWKTYPQLNLTFWQEHQKTSEREAISLLKQSHLDVMTLIDEFSDAELFTKKHYPWTGTTSLASYCISATASHYDWAIKKLRAHIAKMK